MKHRVVVTGLGAASPLDIELDGFWRALTAGSIGIRPIRQFNASDFPCGIAGEAPRFNITEYLPGSYRKAAKLMARDTHLAVLAARQAFDNAFLEPRKDNPDGDPQFGCRMGAGLISADLNELTSAMAQSQADLEFDLNQWGAGGMNQLTPLWLLKYLPNMVASHLTIIYGLTGASNTITAAEASGHLAVGEAFRAIQRGDADRALCGGAESKVNPLSLARQMLFGRLNCSANDNPTQAVRPFEEDAPGTVIGEGAGVLILESLEVALNRSATIYAEVCGFGASQEPFTPQGVNRSCTSYRTALINAMREGGIEPEKLGMLIPCGTGCPKDDQAEAIELRAVFGNSLTALPLATPKRSIGNLFAGNAIDLVIAVLSLHHQVIPPSVNLASRELRPRIKDAAAVPLTSAACSTYSMTGQNAAIVFRRLEN
jgi:3-oxoacyl-[acyl-carrier-protein] synthase II